MLTQFRLFRRSGIYYAKDKATGRAESLATRDAAEAQRFLAAKNQATAQPHLNMSMARASFFAP